MFFFANHEPAFWQTQSVARAIGLNLTEALADRRLAAGDYDRIVRRCRNCGLSPACSQWLAVPAQPADGAPTFCPNKPDLDRVRARAAV